jgi:hypothetical protein
MNFNNPDKDTFFNCLFLLKQVKSNAQFVKEINIFKLSCSHAVVRFCSQKNPLIRGFRIRLTPDPGPRSPNQLQTVTESEHEIEHLRRVISPFVIAVPGDIINLKPERKDFRIAVFRTESEVYMNRFFDHGRFE